MRFSRAKPMLRQVSVSGLGLTTSCGAGARRHGDTAAGQPAERCDDETGSGQPTGSTRRRRAAPASVPIRIATKVPASTSALPPISSSSFRCCGRIAYLTGPNSVECRPSRNSAAISTARLCNATGRWQRQS